MGGFGLVGGWGDDVVGGIWDGAAVAVLLCEVDSLPGGESVFPACDVDAEGFGKGLVAAVVDDEFAAVFYVFQEEAFLLFG